MKMSDAQSKAPSVVLPVATNLASWKEIMTYRMRERNREGIGRQIRENRERLHLSVTELARSIGQSPQTISNWESGLARPEWDDMGKLTEALAYPVQAFFGVPVERRDLTRDEQLFLNDYFELPDEERRAIDMILRRMAQTAPNPSNRVPHLCADDPEGSDHFSLIESSPIPDSVVTVRDASLCPLYSPMDTLGIVYRDPDKETGLYRVRGRVFLLTKGKNGLTLPGLPKTWVPMEQAEWIGSVTGCVQLGPEEF